ncbi:hypothetical protein ACIGXA_35520 [Streptomyces fildesensis]|uniref:Integral membrane protein n=1 Tax=Streptomyces fildesensis TaxID=375757 RepID=A0ABW8CI98_9ACTN
MHETPPPGVPAEDLTETMAERLKERIYATITMIAVVVGLTMVDDLEAGDAAVSVAATSLGLWLATLVADDQGHRAVHHRSTTWPEFRRLLYVSSPLLLSAAGPLILIGVSATGAMALHSGLIAAATVDVVGLFAWGFLAGVRMGGGLVAALVAGTLDTAIGAAVVLVKLTAGH